MVDLYIDMGDPEEDAPPPAPLVSTPLIPEGSLLMLMPCCCYAGAVEADGGRIPHAVLHHVRWVTFEE